MLTAFATLLSHYKRHPGQLAMLLLGLWVASALWSGVQAINASARDSYARAEALFTTGLDRLERRDGEPLTRDDYLRLRRAGLPVSPLLEGSIEAPDGTQLTVIGIEPFTLPGDNAFAAASSQGELTDFLTPPWQTRVAPDTLPALGVSHREAPGAAPRLAEARLPPLILAPRLPPDTLVMDIAAAATLLDSGERITRLVTAPDALEQAPAGLVLTRAATLVSPGQLTESFHLNLTAMALLALVVGLFIVQAALGLALEQRLGLLRTLRALGVSGRGLVGLLALELLLLGVVGALAGIVSGVWLARALQPDVAATLGSLYGADVAVTLNLPWHYWFGGLAVTLGGLLLAGSGVLWRAARLSVLGLGQAQAWRSGFQRQLKLMSAAGGAVALGGLALWLWLAWQPPSEGLLAGFGLVAALLLASALWLPPLIALLLAGLGRLLRRRPLAQWALADLQLQLPRLALAMMALLIALSANLGVSSMVGGFRLTFLDWLDQRLVADFYLRPPVEQHDDIHAWLAKHSEVEELLPTRRSEGTLIAVERDADTRELALPVGVYGITPGAALLPSWPLLATRAGRDEAWQAFAAGEAAFVNEQLAIAEGVAPGDRIGLTAPGGEAVLPVAAVYPDYGNTRGEVLLATPELARRFAAPPGSIGIVLAPGGDGAALRTGLRQHFAIGGDELVDQREVKRIATGIFERTFTITRALSALTLGVAALALLASLLAQARERRLQLAPLWALGVPRQRLVTVQLAQLGGASFVVGALALPLGMLLALGLVAVINVAAFGWRLPLYVFPGEMALTLATAVGVALAAAALPATKLWRTPPRALLAEEAT
ncbi:FtsX-like permease family protein [Billgrantia tianxiuensis]|jgi:putative ABC transport system permease protein|uniref:FtsX-like permease family protein n=1 Tax=Billgrantia tianxiuensis TaxID=2497861 RepID=A0A6I6SGS5_9GAMM|nr:MULTISPECIES: ABC transporter permease [Halomonas]MCE8034861.1 ABC transporter permease [Halomonas sp. MCCC 1A11057]QHC48601.1 FtsX-like permease family protein [Halomonas tianxiuensis]